MSTGGAEGGRDSTDSAGREEEPRGWASPPARPGGAPPQQGGSSPAARPTPDYPYGPPPAPAGPPPSAQGRPTPWRGGADVGPPVGPTAPPAYAAPTAYGPPPGYSPPPPGYGAYSAWGQGRYDGGPAISEPARTPTSTIVLLVVSGICLISGLLALAGIPGLIIGAVAAARVRTDPQRAVELTRIGWWVVGGVLAAGVLLALLLLGALLTAGFSTSYGLLLP